MEVKKEKLGLRRGKIGLRGGFPKGTYIELVVHEVVPVTEVVVDDVHVHEVHQGFQELRSHLAGLRLIQLRSFSFPLHEVCSRVPGKLVVGRVVKDTTQLVPYRVLVQTIRGHHHDLEMFVYVYGVNIWESLTF